MRSNKERHRRFVRARHRHRRFILAARGLRAGAASTCYAGPMTKLSGTIKKSDLEGGHWLLVTKDGAQYQLEGAKGVKDGAHVVVEGKVEKAAFGIGMTGPILKVTKVTPADAKK